MLSWIWSRLMRRWALPILRFVWHHIPAWVKPWLKPAEPADIRPSAGTFEALYIRSFLVVRLAIGLIGLLLPLALILFDWWVFSGNPHPRGSESVYYYSGMREVFTVSIGTVAFFLFIYKIFERNLDNTLSMVAGLAGMLIPLFPTHRPAALAAQYPDTDLQKLYPGNNPDWTAYVHYSATAAFIIGLGGIIVLFGRREGKRPVRDTRFSPPRLAAVPLHVREESSGWRHSGSSLRGSHIAARVSRCSSAKDLRPQRSEPRGLPRASSSSTSSAATKNRRSTPLLL